VETLERLLRDHPFLHGMSDEHIRVLLGCAKNVRFEPDDFLLREGEEANRWYLIRGGLVGIETHVPGQGPVRVGSLEENDVLGWSWLVPPYLWHFDARALTVTRAVALDGTCLRQKCEADHDLGFEIVKRFLHVLQERLNWARLQMLDMYKGNP